MVKAALVSGWFRRLYSASVGTIRQSYAALLASVFAASLAGFLLGRFDGFFMLLPGLIIMVPGAIGMRGNIFSSMGSRLGTQMHLGLVSGFDLNNDVVRRNVKAPILLTVVMSVVLGFYARVLSGVLGVESVSLESFVVMSFIAGVLSGFIMIALTFGISFLSFARGLDPDNVTSPLIAATGDLFTLPSLLAGAFIVLNNQARVELAFYFVMGVFVLGFAYSRRGSDGLRRIFYQTVGVMLFSSLVSSLAGVVMQDNLGLLFASSSVLVMIPAFLGCGGSIGNILSARLSTKLHLGLIEPNFSVNENVISEFFVAIVLALLVFPFIGAAAHVFTGLAGGSSPGLWSMVFLSTLSGVVLAVVVTAATFTLSVKSYGRGWNPDNVLIPVVSSSADFLGIVTLLASAAVLGLF